MEGQTSGERGNAGNCEEPKRAEGQNNPQTRRIGFVALRYGCSVRRLQARNGRYPLWLSLTSITGLGARSKSADLDTPCPTNVCITTSLMNSSAARIIGAGILPIPRYSAQRWP